MGGSGFMTKVIAAVLFILVTLYTIHYTNLQSQSQLNDWLRLRVEEASIPNRVHYTQLMKDPSADLHFQFKQFLSIYAAHLHYAPKAIYIHTDASEEVVEQARKSLDSTKEPWTSLILSLPNVQIRRVTPPLAMNGKTIKHIEHKSDFVRMDAVYEMGGIYMDWDVHPLRDIGPLREAGFANVVGRQLHGKIQNGVFMSQPGTAMVGAWRADAHAVFDGSWEAHSIKLLMRVAERMVRAEREVLILDEKTFAPTSWKVGSQMALFSSHFETPVMDEVNAPADDTDAQHRYANPDKDVEPWQLDFSASYAIHAFAPHGTIDNFTEITPEYIFARQSNLARALYPVAKHALDAGLFKMER